MKYYINENGQQYGPFSVEQLRLRGITSETPVWCDGMAQWSKAKNVPELLTILSNAQTGYNNLNNTYRPQPSGECPNNHLTMAIIATILTFLCCGILGAVFGIIAIVSSNKVDRCWREGNYDEAFRQAKKAKTWSIVSFVLSALGFIISVLYMIFVLGVAFSEVADTCDYYNYY